MIFFLDLKNIYYAKSIKVLFTLVNNAANFQPPVFVVEYAELSLSDIGKQKVAQVTIEFMAASIL